MCQNLYHVSSVELRRYVYAPLGQAYLLEFCFIAFTSTQWHADDFADLACTEKTGCLEYPARTWRECGCRHRCQCPNVKKGAIISPSCPGLANNPPPKFCAVTKFSKNLLFPENYRPRIQNFGLKTPCWKNFGTEFKSKIRIFITNDLFFGNLLLTVEILSIWNSQYLSANSNFLSHLLKLFSSGDFFAQNTLLDWHLSQGPHILSPAKRSVKALWAPQVDPGTA